MPTETRTYVGELTGYPFGGWAGVRVGQQYELTYTKEFDEVRLVLDHHEHVSPGGGPLVARVVQWRQQEKA